MRHFNQEIEEQIKELKEDKKSQVEDQHFNYHYITLHNPLQQLFLPFHSII